MWVRYGLAKMLAGADCVSLFQLLFNIRVMRARITNLYEWLVHIKDRGMAFPGAEMRQAPYSNVGQVNTTGDKVYRIS